MALENAPQIFADQVSTGQLLQNVVYASGCAGGLLIIAGLILGDAGGIRRGNNFNATIEKLVGFFISFAVYYVIGFAIWVSQYYIMFQGPDYPANVAFWDAIKAWWIGGDMMNSLAQHIDPAIFPGLNTFQIFAFFLAAFTGLINLLLHLAVGERMKASAFYVTCVVSTIVSAILSQWTWGSVGWLTNAGYHDYFGAGFVYLFPGGMAIVFAKALGHRPGMFSEHPKVPSYVVPNLGLATTCVVMVFAGMPLVIIACMFFFDPGALGVSITMADTSVGIALNNFGAAWAGGSLSGALIAYKTRKYAYLLLGPFAGHIAGASGFDIYVPWQMFLVCAGAPFVAYFIYEATLKMKIDEHKLIPLMAGCGSYGLLMIGVLHSGTPHGGFVGLEGDYAFQHAQVSLGMQALGIVVSLGLGIVTALVLTPILKATTGLRVSEDDQANGVDLIKWGVTSDVVPNLSPSEAQPQKKSVGQLNETTS
ncbi:ammonium transporter [Ruegeria atlantica]|uniref:ammonium transporter n=1 Tax=Ruegeria atlantica TaxID=81569 RepID=UPI00147A78A3|nr:ammonium transporter [Ruegeria atlantica]